MPIAFQMLATARFSVLSVVSEPPDLPAARLVGGRRVGAANRRSPSQEPEPEPEGPSVDGAVQRLNLGALKLTSPIDGASQKLQSRHLVEEQRQHCSSKAFRPSQAQNNRNRKSRGLINQPRGQNH